MLGSGELLFSVFGISSSLVESDSFLMHLKHVLVDSIFAEEDDLARDLDLGLGGLFIGSTIEGDSLGASARLSRFGRSGVNLVQNFLDRFLK